MKAIVGELVQSTKGRDLGQIYLVVSVTKDGDCYLVNGDNRTFKNPKLKNSKHIKSLGCVVTHLQQKLLLNKCIYDNEVFSCINGVKEK